MGQPVPLHVNNSGILNKGAHLTNVLIVFAFDVLIVLNKGLGVW